MSSDAFRWWNSLVSEEPENPAAPSIFSPEDAPLIFPVLSPILHNHTNYALQMSDCWMQVRSIIVKLTKDDSCPNPNSNFPCFVEYWYKYRHVIKPTKVEGCINYVDAFCPDPVVDEFFMKDLEFAICDPDLCVQTLSELHKRGDQRWIQCLSNHGFVDRVFDLFMPFLIVFDKCEDIHFPFRLRVADFLLMVFEYNHGVLQEDISKDFYTRLTYLIEKAKVGESISFFLIAKKLNDMTIQSLSNDQKMSRMNTLLGLSLAREDIRRPILMYLYKMNDIIDGYDVVKKFTKELPTAAGDLESMLIFTKGEMKESFDTRILVVRYYAKTLVQSIIFMKAAASLLVEMLQTYDNEEVRDWMDSFIRRVFIFIEIATTKKKASNRAISILSTISSSNFQSVKWVWDLIVEYASECYRDGVGLIKTFIEVTDAKNELYQREMKIFGPLNLSLINFPFKNHSTSLSENQETRKYIKRKEAPMNAKLAKLSIPSSTLRYIFYDEDSSPADQQQAIFQLEDFIEEQKARLAECEKVHKSVKYPKIEKADNVFKMAVTGLILFCQETENLVWEYQNKSIADLLRQLHSIMETISKFPHVLPNIKLIMADHNAVISDNPKYKELKRNRRRMKSYALASAAKYGTADYKDLLFTQIPNSVFSFDYKIMYSPPSLSDQYMYEYLLKSKFAEMLNAATTVFEDGTINAAAATLEVLNCAVVEDIDRTNGFAVQVSWMSIFRIIFDRLYKDDSILNRYKSANTEYLRRADAFLKKTIDEAKIPECIVGMMRKGATVGSLMKTKKVASFMPLQFMVNPIDIVFHIFTTIKSLDSLVGDTCVTREELSIIVLATVALNPPANIVSIIKFVNRWIDFVASYTMVDSFKLFKKSVDRLLCTDYARDDNKTDDGK